jgi:hypothetical protein
MGRVGKFIIGGILIGASFVVGGPGASQLVAGLANLLLAGGVSLASAAIFGRTGTGLKQDGILNNYPSSNAPLPVIYGKTLVGIRPVDIRTAGTNNNELWIVGALCHGSSDGNGIAGIDEIYFDNKLAVDAAGVVQDPWVGLVTVYKYTGTFTQNVSSNNGSGGTLNATFPTAWPVTSAGLGIATLVLHLTFNKEKFAGGIPNVTTKVRGCKVLDTRVGGAFVYSTNPALCINDYLTSNLYGLGATTAEIDSASINAMANYYDELVSIDVGTQKRFEINGWLDVGQPVPENVRQMLTSCRGNLIYEGGKFRLFTRAAKTAETFVLNESNIHGDWSFRVPGIKECGNSIIGTWLNPDQDRYQADEVQYPRPDAVNSYLINDNNYLVEHRAEMPMTISKYTAEQILNVALKETRAGMSATVTCSEAALQLHIGDVVNVTHSTPGWVNKPFWVMAMLLMPTGLVRITLLEYDSNAYSLDAQTTLPAFPATSLPDPRFCQPPSELDLSADDAQAVTDRDGSDLVYLLASWTASPDPYLDCYEVQYKVTSGPDTDWQPTNDALEKDVFAKVGPLAEGVSYSVRVRAVNTLGVKSEWLTDDVVPNLAKFRTGSVWVDDMSSETPGRRWKQMDPNATGTLQDVVDPDASVGGRVGRFIGSGWWEFQDNIPFDPSIDYVMRVRVRQKKSPTTGSKRFSIGVAGIAQVPGQSEKFSYVNTFGANQFDNQHFVVAKNMTLDPSRSWTDYYGYIQGIAGGTFTLTSSMITATGLGSFDATKCCDGDVDAVAFNTDSAAAGAILHFNLGTAQIVTEARLHTTAAGSTATWDLEYSDDDVTWFKAAADVVFSLAGWESGSTRLYAALSTPGQPPPTDPPPPPDDPGDTPPTSSNLRTMFGVGNTDSSLWGLFTPAPDSQLQDTNGANWVKVGGYIDVARAANACLGCKFSSEAQVKTAAGDYSLQQHKDAWTQWLSEVRSVTGGEAKFRAAVRDGVIRYFEFLDDYAGSNPGVNFNKAVTFEELEGICAWIKADWNWIPLVGRGSNTYNRQAAAAAGAGTRVNGVRQYQYMDAGAAQWVHYRDGDPVSYVATQVRLGQECGLGVRGGANVLRGGNGPTRTAVPLGWDVRENCTGPTHWTMSPAELRAIIDAMMDNPHVACFVGWNYQGGPSCTSQVGVGATAGLYINRSDIAAVFHYGWNTKVDAAGRLDPSLNIRGDLGVA